MYIHFRRPINGNNINDWSKCLFLVLIHQQWIICPSTSYKPLDDPWWTLYMYDFFNTMYFMRPILCCFLVTVILKRFLPFTLSISIDQINVPNRNTVIRFGLTMKVSYCIYMYIDLIHIVYIKNFRIDILDRINQVTLSMFEY